MPFPMARFLVLEPGFHAVPVDKGDDAREKGESQDNEKGPIILRLHRLSLHGQKKGSGEAADRRNDHEGGHVHGAQAQDVAKIIFGRSGDEKEYKGKKGPLVLHEVVEFGHELLADKFSDKGQTKVPGDREGDQRAEDKAGRGVDKTGSDAEEKPADEAGQLSGDRGEENLQGLQSHKNSGGVRSIGGDISV